MRLLSCVYCDFNPRSREGSDLMSGFTRYTKRNFNPRSREGSDRAIYDGLRCQTDFNPRSREGSDQPPTVLE